MTTTTKPALRPTSGRRLAPPPVAPKEPRLQVQCSTASWSISGPTTSGGDVADSFALSNECSIAAVWDAAGHDKAAASAAVLVWAGLRAMLSANPDIVVAVRALNRVLYRHAQTSMPWPSVSGFFGVVNRESRTLHYISCGHETAILFRGRSSHVHLLHNSPLLGITEAADLTLDTMRVNCGDRLVIVSNGLTDARPLVSPTEFFGTARVCSYFHSRPSGFVADAAQLIEHVVRFAGGTLADDAAALIARFD